MARHVFARVAFFLVLVLALIVVVETANAALALENVRVWYWTDNTHITSVTKADVDADGNVETVTGGYLSDGTHDVAQLCVWDGVSLALEGVKTWQWGDGTRIESVAVADVDKDGAIEIVTGGFYHYDARSHYAAQLCIWSGASLALENVRTWEWDSSSVIFSVAVGDIDSDSAVEIVTGGHYYGGIAQLCVWSGASLTLENVRCWYWTSFTYIHSVAVGDVDGDGAVEIVTGGVHNDVTGYAVAQLCVWSGASLALENVRTWKWPMTTQINSVAVGDVDGDSAVEIVTGGYYNDGSRNVAQLCIWNGDTLALENVKTWYWGVETIVYSVALGDVDGDGAVEIVTGGEVLAAQLCVWSGFSLALEDVQVWYWTSSTYVFSVAAGDVDGDAKTEIITGGEYFDGIRWCAQLCVWSV